MKFAVSTNTKFVTCFIAMILSTSSISAAEISTPVNVKAESPFKLTYKISNSDNKMKIDLKWNIAKDAYIYKKRVSITSNTLPIPFSYLGRPSVIYDQNLTEYLQVFFNELDIEIKDLNIKDRKIRITIQGCSKEGICYLPQSETIDLK